jgi:hypothetical protein
LKNRLKKWKKQIEKMEKNRLKQFKKQIEKTDLKNKMKKTD